MAPAWKLNGAGHVTAGIDVRGEVERAISEE
jgi:hypothetical protein